MPIFTLEKLDGAMAASLGIGIVEASAIDGYIERRYLVSSFCLAALPRNYVSLLMRFVSRQAWLSMSSSTPE